MTDRKSKAQLIWGIALVAMGVGVFFRIPQVMPQIEQIEQFSRMLIFIKFSFYLIGILLIGGGLKKLMGRFHQNDATIEKENNP